MPSDYPVKVTGKLSRSDFGMGGWCLQTDEGKKVDLYGAIPKELEHKRVQVRGRSVDVGIGMGEAALRVEHITILND